jgi:hypothetical protein
MRKIRAHLLETREEQWQVEVIRGPSPLPVEETAVEDFGEAMQEMFVIR